MFGSDLDAGDHLERIAGGALRGGDAVEGVVIGDGDRGQAAAPPPLDDLRRAIGAVARRGVNVQTDAAAASRPGQRLAERRERLAGRHGEVGQVSTAIRVLGERGYGESSAVSS